MIIKVFLQDDLGKEVKQEELRAQDIYVIKLKEIYLPINTLLLKCNNIILSELEYYKQSEKHFEEKINTVYKRMEDKMASEFATMKKSMSEFFENFIYKSKADHDQESSKKDKKSRKSSSKDVIDSLKL